MTAKPVLLQVNNLRTYFSTEEGIVRAVDGISFTIHESERFGVVGESGSGKSVTALSIMRLIEPPAGNIATGEIFYKGRNLLEFDDENMRKIRGGEIAMIFQDPMTALNPVYTVGNQLIETITLHQKVKPDEAFEIGVDALKDVQIPNPEQRMKDYPHQLSGGMRQRVMIAMGLSCNPSLLIADEPTTALDVTTQAQILDLMLHLADDRGTAVMLITHDLGVVAGFCDTIQVMYGGRLAERGSTGEIFDKTLHPYTAGLLGAMTRLDEVRPERLYSIKGAPPSLINPGGGCRFAVRCDFAQDRCRAEVPLPREIAEGHWAACHFATDLDLSRVKRKEAAR
ncbi:MAG: peptide ABC transporter ATP-binding protein [Actinobacteria bacterium RBG_16_68_21]|nr:MAG: peptide ABC transporter ATP-binding protein [Actinobacteria bacterium RBG_16_68_21]